MMSMATTETIAGPALRPKRWADHDTTDPREGLLAQAGLEALTAAMLAADVPIGDVGPGAGFLQALHVSPEGKASLRIDVPVRVEREDPQTLAEQQMFLLTAEDRRLQCLNNWSYAALARQRWLATEPKFIVLDADGIRRLADAHAEMSRRRALVDEENETERAAAAAAEVRAAAVEAAREEHQRRAAAWGARSREYRLFTAAADELPEFRPLLEQLAELGSQDRIGMPATWKP